MNMKILNIFKRKPKPDSDPHEYLDKAIAQKINWEPDAWTLDTHGAAHDSGVYVVERNYGFIRVFSQKPLEYVDNGAFYVDMKGQRTRAALDELRQDHLVKKLQPAKA